MREGAAAAAVGFFYKGAFYKTGAHKCAHFVIYTIYEQGAENLCGLWAARPTYRDFRY